MKTIIAGSRTITDYDILRKVLKECPWEITEIVSGTARGVDILGERYAEDHGIPLKRFPADWNNLAQPGAKVKLDSRTPRQYNSNAGHFRNEQMAQYAEACVLIWDGKSTGTLSMWRLAQRYGLKILVVNTLTCEKSFTL